MANYNINKPKFNWDCQERLVELENFKTDINILFDGPYKKMEKDERASLVLNWLDRQTTMIIQSQGITPLEPKDIFDALTSVFCPKSSDTIAKFQFRSMHQKQNQSIDIYLTGLRLAIPECSYHKHPNDLLKDQFIFGIGVKEIQDTLLSKISSDDMIGKCLLEARKVEPQLEQRKLLGIKPMFVMMLLASMIATKDTDLNQTVRDEVEAVVMDVVIVVAGSRVEVVEIVTTVESKHPPRKCPTYGWICNNCNGKYHYSLACKSRARSQSQNCGSQKGQQNKQSRPKNK